MMMEITESLIRSILPVPPISLLKESYLMPTLAPDMLGRMFTHLVSLGASELQNYQDRALEEHAGIVIDRLQLAQLATGGGGGSGSASSGGAGGPGAASTGVEREEGGDGTDRSLKRSMQMPTLVMSHYKLFSGQNYQEEAAALRPYTPYSEEVVLTNRSQRNIKFTVERYSTLMAKYSQKSQGKMIGGEESRRPQEMIVELSPGAAVSDGVVKKSMSLKLKVTVIPRRSGMIKDMLVITLDNDIRLYLVISVQVLHKVYGMDPAMMELKRFSVTDLKGESTDNTTSVSVMIPAFVADLSALLITQKCHLHEGVFRVSSSAEFLQALHRNIDAHGLQFVNWEATIAKDPHTVGNLLRAWFRELPTPLLGILTPGNINSLDEKFQAISTALAQRRAEPAAPVEKSGDMDVDVRLELMIFVISLLKYVVGFQQSNRMTARGLAVVWAPTLYRVEPTPGSAQPSASSGGALHALGHIVSAVGGATFAQSAEDVAHVELVAVEKVVHWLVMEMEK